MNIFERIKLREELIRFKRKRRVLEYNKTCYQYDKSVPFSQEDLDEINIIIREIEDVLDDNKSIQFKGMPSGDYESFCWDVSLETFKQIKGINPDEFDKSCFNKEQYKIYPNDLFDNKKEYTVIIK